MNKNSFYPIDNLILLSRGLTNPKTNIVIYIPKLNLTKLINIADNIPIKNHQHQLTQ